MQRFIKLNLESNAEKAGPPNLPDAERKEPERPVLSKRVHRLVNKAAHKAATEFSRGIFSK